MILYVTDLYPETITTNIVQIYRTNIVSYIRGKTLNTVFILYTRCAFIRTTVTMFKLFLYFARYILYMQIILVQRYSFAVLSVWKEKKSIHLPFFRLATLWRTVRIRSSTNVYPIQYIMFILYVSIMVVIRYKNYVRCKILYE